MGMPQETQAVIVGTAEELARVRQLSRLARLMDSAISIPGTSVRIGVDPLIGLIPGLGDFVGALISGYIVLAAAKLGVSRLVLGRMFLNLVIDQLAGTIPLLGDFFDVGWKANIRNVALLEDAMSRRALDVRNTTEAKRAISFVLVATFLTLFAVVSLCTVLVTIFALRLL